MQNIGTTSVKTNSEIELVRKLYEEDGYPFRKIAREMHYSINTVRKIIRKVYGYEGDTFDREERWKNVGHLHTGVEYISDIDGETLYLQKSESKDGYYRVSTNNQRETLHTHEAKKVYNSLGLLWKKNYIVHHINSNRSDCSAKNLHIFNSNGLHMQYHARLERLIYKFMSDNYLLEQFYSEYPDIKLSSLYSLINNEDQITI